VASLAAKVVVTSTVLSATTLAFLWAIAGIVLGGTFTYMAARLQVRHAYRTRERSRLLRLRTDAFHRLWGLTGCMPRHPDDGELARFRAAAVVRDLNRWYFTDGGIYLPNSCREEYFLLLDRLEAVGPSKGIDRASYIPIYAAASKLRQTLARELDARTSTSGKAI